MDNFVTYHIINKGVVLLVDKINGKYYKDNEEHDTKISKQELKDLIEKSDYTFLVYGGSREYYIK